MPLEEEMLGMLLTGLCIVVGIVVLAIILFWINNRSMGVSLDFHSSFGLYLRYLYCLRCVPYRLQPSYGIRGKFLTFRDRWRCLGSEHVLLSPRNILFY